ncbi:TetR/AcrR family transcriptional regulator [Nocardioides aurantiacus]|uniref:TetR/AcrR family transcriptional regulator n=1 Tax=Nocardioides aurantiacus TaxID=86796 RepID=UPI00403F4F31
MPQPAHRPSQRTAVLDAALGLLRGDAALSLDSAARAAGVSKPGLMYHFPTKEALVAALVDHVVDRYERELTALVHDGGGAVEDDGVGGADAHARLAAYVHWSITHDHDPADLVMLADPRLRQRMAERWAERLAVWVAVPADLPPGRRARCQAARLLADGCWFADASGVLPVPADDRDALLDLALGLLGEEA